MVERPTEVITGGAAVGVGAVVEVLSGFGVDVPAKVAGGLIVLIGLLAPFVTKFVAKSQRARTLGSAPDGKVLN